MAATYLDSLQRIDRKIVSEVVENLSGGGADALEGYGGGCPIYRLRFESRKHAGY